MHEGTRRIGTSFAPSVARRLRPVCLPGSVDHRGTACRTSSGPRGLLGPGHAFAAVLDVPSRPRRESGSGQRLRGPGSRDPCGRAGSSTTISVFARRGVERRRPHRRPPYGGCNDTHVRGPIKASGRPESVTVPASPSTGPVSHASHPRRRHGDGSRTSGGLLPPLHPCGRAANPASEDGGAADQRADDRQRFRQLAVVD